MLIKFILTTYISFLAGAITGIIITNLFKPNRKAKYNAADRKLEKDKKTWS